MVRKKISPTFIITAIMAIVIAVIAGLHYFGKI